MTAPTIREQTTQPYVGDVIELFHIDLRPIGIASDYYLTPSSDRPISFGGNTYTPCPISITGKNSDANAAPGRVNLTISNLTSMLAAIVISAGDITGANVNYIRTFKNYLDGQPEGGTNQSFGSLSYRIYQKTAYNVQFIQWALTTPLDRPDVMLPLRQCLKSDQVANSVWCPGMQRVRV